MSDYVDLGPIISAVNALSSQIGTVNSNIRVVSGQVDTVNARVNNVQDRLAMLAKEFIQMRDENRRNAALQRALTEIVRVRQELEREFGNYKIVRNTMLGILEATDVSLIRNSTIAGITEELMLTTPRYWLAPVLIALAAWIADNRPLAERALKEALRRDEEKTCLTFALICRRNKRTETCFKWLARYFAYQKANDMKESIIAYIDAYTNGVFGVDRDDLCAEYISHWMKELQTNNPNLEQEQITYWKGVYQTYCRDTKSQYAKLAECAPAEFAKMNEHIMRINAAPEIIAFFKNILDTPVDQQSLIDAIDNQLINLVKNYDKDEAPLREEEAYLTDIRDSKGDEKWANERKRLRDLRKLDRPVNLADRLSLAITDNNTSGISAKKTAINFMQSYIKTAFGEFLAEKAPYVPNEITIHTHGWQGKTSDGSNKAALLADYTKVIEGRRANALAEVKNTGAYVCFGFFFLIIPIFMGISKLKKNKAKRKAINEAHDNYLANGKRDIELSIQQMSAIKEKIGNFSAEESCAKLLETEVEENE